MLVSKVVLPAIAGFSLITRLNVSIPTSFCIDGGSNLKNPSNSACFNEVPREYCMNSANFRLRSVLSCIFPIVVAVAALTSAISDVCLFRFIRTTATSPNIYAWKSWPRRTATPANRRSVLTLGPISAAVSM